MQLTETADAVFAASDDSCKCRAVEALKIPAGYILMNSVVQTT